MVLIWSDITLYIKQKMMTILIFILLNLYGQKNGNMSTVRFFFDELRKTFCFFNNRYGQSRYIIKLPWEFAFINTEIINQLYSIGLFAISIDFSNDPIFFNEYIRNYENYCIEIWFDFCDKHSYVNDFENLGFFFRLV